MFCKFCGQQISDYADTCPYCMKNLDNELYKNVPKIVDKDWRITIILCVLLGPLGIHRFYTGHSGLGILYWITLGGFCGLLPLIDLIQLIRNKYKDAANKVLTHYNETVSNILAFCLCIGIVASIVYIKTENIDVVEQFKPSSSAVTKNLSKVSVEYLQDYNYANFYNDKTRNIVFYTKYDSSPEMQMLADRVEKYSIHPQYRKYFNFTYFKSGERKRFKTQKEADGWNAFTKQCHGFCIVNPKTDEITYVRKISQDTVYDLYNIFNTHKN